MFKSFRNVSFLFLIFTLIDFCPLKISAEENTKQINNSNAIPLDYLEYKPENEYILGKGDKIFIGFNNDLIKDESFTINDDGTIYTKRLRRIYVSGLTLNELTNLLNLKYQEFIINPNINVEIINYRPIRIFITGEVVSPGSYLLRGREIVSTSRPQNEFNEYVNDEKLRGLGGNRNLTIFNELRRSNVNNLATPSSYTAAPTIFDAIKEAKGITLYSDLTNVEVIRKNPLSKGGGKIKANLNFFEFIETGSGNQNIKLMDGDTIIVKKSKIPLNEQYIAATKTNLQSQFMRVFVSGRVVEPGVKLISKSATLNDLMLLSGGIKTLRGDIYLVRFNYDGTLTRKKFKYRRNAKPNSKNNPILRTGDIISVDTNILLKTSNTLADITNPFVGILSSYNFFKMLTGN